VLLFGNDGQPFVSAELKKESLSPSATSLVGQRAQLFHRTAPGQVSGTAQKVNRHALETLKSYRGLGRFDLKTEALAVSTKTATAPTTTRTVRDQRRCPVGEVFDEIERTCVPSRSQVDTALQPGLQPFATIPVQVAPIPVPEEDSPVVPRITTAAVPVPAPAPVVPATQVPASIVQTAPLVSPGVSPLLQPVRSPSAVPQAASSAGITPILVSTSGKQKSLAAEVLPVLALVVGVPFIVWLSDKKRKESFRRA
jgi:hypothetical protein